MTEYGLKSNFYPKKSRSLIFLLFLIILNYLENHLEYQGNYGMLSKMVDIKTNRLSPECEFSFRISNPHLISRFHLKWGEMRNHFPRIFLSLQNL